MSPSDFDDDVLEALAAERERTSPLDAAAKRRVTARLVGSLGGLAGTLAVGAALGAGAGAGAGAATKVAESAGVGAGRAALTKLVVVAVAAFAAGSGVHAAYTRASARDVEAGPSTATHGPSAAALRALDAEAPPVVAVPVVSVATLPEAPKPASSALRGPSAPELRLRERALLEAAQSALARGHADEALESARRHATEFPLSELAEEREAIRARALAKGGRCAEARAVIARFVAAYPSSLQRASLEGLCREASP